MNMLISVYDFLDLQRCTFPVPPCVFTTCSTVHCWILSPDKLHLLCVLNQLCDFENPSRSSSLVAWHVEDLFNDSSIRHLTRIISATRHVMLFLHGSIFTLLAKDNTSCATPRHARRCLLRQSLQRRLRTQLEFLKQHTPTISIRIMITTVLTLGLSTSTVRHLTPTSSSVSFSASITCGISLASSTVCSWI